MESRSTSRDFEPQRVLVVEDEPALVEVLRGYLRDEGFEVIVAGDGQTGFETALREEPDIVLLDLILPRMSGIEAFRRIRAASTVPVIMVTARAAEIDRVVGLELGADDYISKPFSPREVVARVKAVLRRAGSNAAPRSAAPANAEPDVTRVGSLEIDRTAHEVRRRGVPLPLTPMEFRALDVLASHVGRAFTRQQILDRISLDGDVYDRTLDRHIANLRHKIEDEPARPQLILTVVGVGYKLVDPHSGAPRTARTSTVR